MPAAGLQRALGRTPSGFRPSASNKTSWPSWRPEQLEGDCEDATCDRNGDGDLLDTILRIYRLAEDCGGRVCVEELTGGLNSPLAADADPVVNGRSLSVSRGRVFFTVREGAVARQTTIRVSVTSSGGEATGGSQEPSISADGQHVAFTSDASNLLPGSTTPAVSVFVHHRHNGATVLASAGPTGAEGAR